MSDVLLDFDLPGVRKLALAAVRSATGLHRWQLTKVRNPKSLVQLGWYWGAIIPRLIVGIEQTWGERYDGPTVHSMMKERFLRREAVDKRTGEVVQTYTLGLSELDTAQATYFFDQIILFAAEWLGTEIPPPDRMWRQQPQGEPCKSSSKTSAR